MSNPDEREIVSLIRCLLNLSPVETVAPIGGGADHCAFEVTGGLIARVPKLRTKHTRAAIEREVALLGILARSSPIPVPEVVAADPPAGLIVLRRLPGTSLFGRSSSNPMAFAQPLADFVASIHGVAAALVEHLVEPDEYPLDRYLTDAREQMQHAASPLTSTQRRRIERFLESPPPSESDRRTFCHNDLGAEHILAAENRPELTGVIDWSDAAITDPARDVGRLLRDFGFGVAEAVICRTGDDEHTLTRAMFHARIGLLEDLAYGVEASQPQYVASALARFAETFSGHP